MKRNDDESGDGKLIQQLAMLHSVAEMMQETDTIEALGEYWYD